MSYRNKYIKYKSKYLALKNQVGSGEYTFTVKEPWFTYIQKGTKKAEGRLNKGIFSKLKVGDIIIWINSATLHNKKLKCKVVVTYIKKYDTFRDLLQGENIDKVLPNIKNMDQGVGIYRQYYSEKDEQENGVIAIGMQIQQETVHEGKLKEEYYKSVKEGKKIYEVRVNDDKRRKMKVDDLWIFSHNDEPSNAHSSHSALHHIQDEPDKPKIKTKIVDIKTYVTFEEAINDTDLSKLLPDIESIKEAIKIYEGFPHDEGTYKEGAKKYGVVRFKLDLVN